MAALSSPSPPSLLSFTPTNWNTSQQWTIAAVGSSLIWGDRWSLVNYSFLTAQTPYLLPFASLFAPLNVTILETNVAGVTMSDTNFTLQKNSADRQLLLSLSCQPRSCRHRHAGSQRVGAADSAAAAVHS